MQRLGMARSDHLLRKAERSALRSVANQTQQAHGGAFLSLTSATAGTPASRLKPIKQELFDSLEKQRYTRSPFSKQKQVLEHVPNSIRKIHERELKPFKSASPARKTRSRAKTQSKSRKKSAVKRNEQLVYFQDKYDFLKQRTYAQIHEQTKQYRYDQQEIHFLNFSPTHNKAEFAAIYTKSPGNSRVCSQKSRKSNSKNSKTRAQKQGLLQGLPVLGRAAYGTRNHLVCATQPAPQGSLRSRRSGGEGHASRSSNNNTLTEQTIERKVRARIDGLKDCLDGDHEAEESLDDFAHGQTFCEQGVNWQQENEFKFSEQLRPPLQQIFINRFLNRKD